MRIVIVAFHFAEYALALALELCASNEVLLVVSELNFKNEVNKHIVDFERERLKIIALPHKKHFKLLISNTLTLTRLINGFKPDVIHIQEDLKDYLIFSIPFWVNKPIVLTVHDPKPHTGIDAQRLKYSRRALYLSYLRKKANAIIVHGDYLCKEAKSVMFHLDAKIYAIPLGPFGKIFKVNVLNRDWDIGSCLFFGRIEAYKGLGVFLDSLELLHKESFPVKGVIAGRGTDLDMYRARIQTMPFVTLKEWFLSPQEVIDCFGDSNIVVLPYLNATQSGVSAYAIGLGRPVIVTSVGGLPEGVKLNETGLVIPPNDSKQLADAIKHLVDNQNLCKRMAQNAYDWGETEISWSQIAKMTIAVYQDVIVRVST